MQLFELTQTAEAVLFRACYESTELRHNFVEPVHFLLALVTVVDNPAGRLLVSAGLNDANVRPLVEKMYPQYPADQVRTVEVLSQTSTLIMTTAITVAQRYQPGSLVTPMHVLTVLITSLDEHVLKIFDTFGINPDRIRLEAARSIMRDVN